MKGLMAAVAATVLGSLACSLPALCQDNASVRPLADPAGATPVNPAGTATEPVYPESAPVVIPPLPSLDDAAARAEADRLQVALQREVPHLLPLTLAQRLHWVLLARNMVVEAGFAITRAQVLVVVDRNPAVQKLALILALPDSSDWHVIGSVKVSTGTRGRKYYFVTPTGVFPNTTDRLGYRAEGTKNEHGIRGIGAKGMRVWDFGWHTAVKGWLSAGETGDIRLEMHATDPDFLESRLGRPASEGCVRIPAAFNVFLDHHGLLDVEYEQAASYDGRFRALLPKNRVPSPIAGEALVVVDSGQQDQASGRS
ncbi:L,D-transpeptidase [Acetobacter fallax]|uniref:L,D-transpeptidase n=1 Tax=Acetobacter fallax TaxID=1737473 RepID=A0ABX0KB07_9PROT|nr:L,D-transpeptidase [Acetobacter fallax]NHO33170.1 L,D-transpeptidase [Acetobacter fallax]NHO36809.1 L,D-transpeptidase [Acetobacter fallax]